MWELETEKTDSHGWAWAWWFPLYLSPPVIKSRHVEIFTFLLLIVPSGLGFMLFWLFSTEVEVSDWCLDLIRAFHSDIKHRFYCMYKVGFRTKYSASPVLGTFPYQPDVLQQWDHSSLYDHWQGFQAFSQA